MDRRAAISTHQLLLIVFLYLFLEWLFLATKPSFLSLLPFGEQVRILFATYLPCLLLGLAVHVPLLLADSLIRRWAPPMRRPPLPAITPAGVAAALGLVQIDNFTYIVLGFGIVHTAGSTAYLYLAGSIGLFLFLILYFSREQAAGIAPRRLRLRVAAAIALVAVSIVSSLWRAAGPIGGRGTGIEPDAADGRGRSLPNIVLLAADGIDADHLSIYGYGRQTTPHLDAFFDDALIIENAVANSSITSGSLTSMLTGKLPTTTRVIFGPPHALAAADAYQHLPGILKHLGYDSLQETVREWGDSADRNMLRAFDVANGRTVGSSTLWGLPEGFSMRFLWEKLFYDKLLDRISKRMLHVLGRQRMEDTFGMVKPLSHREVWGTNDETRVARALAFMKERAGPFFVHLHLLGSHCCPHKPEWKLFSASGSEAAIESREDWTDHQLNLYDDTILSADRHLGNVFAWLEESEEMENTVVVYSSDHTSWWDVTRRIPLLFRFPQGEHQGRVRKTAQLLDVAPTLLDHLGVEAPPWMEGDSLLRPEDLSDLRPIFATWPRLPDRENERWRSDMDWGPPFYGLETLGLALCHRWYRMNVRTGEGSVDEIPNHSAPCADDAFPTEPEITSMIAGHLVERGIR